MEELFADGFEQQIHAAAGQICAAHGAGKEGIAAKKQLFGWKMEANTAHGVAGRMENTAFLLAELDI